MGKRKQHEAEGPGLAASLAGEGANSALLAKLTSKIEATSDPEKKQRLQAALFKLLQSAAATEQQRASAVKRPRAAASLHFAAPEGLGTTSSSSAPPQSGGAAAARASSSCACPAHEHARAWRGMVRGGALGVCGPHGARHRTCALS